MSIGLRRNLLPVLILVILLVGGTASVLADNPLNNLQPFSALGTPTSTTLTGPSPTNPTTPRCSLIQNGPISGSGLEQNAQYTLVLSPWPQPDCVGAAHNGITALSGQLIITHKNGTLAMDVAVADFNGDGAVLTGTYSTPSYNITDPTATTPTPNTGKEFVDAFGSGTVVFATGSSTNAPAGTNPTQSTIALNGLLNGLN